MEASGRRSSTSAFSPASPVGLLRRVEVISTVSGGSIIGALYYLHLKDLLETVPDDEVRDEDYVRIVEHMQGKFLEGVRTTSAPGRTPPFA